MTDEPQENTVKFGYYLLMAAAIGVAIMAGGWVLGSLVSGNLVYEMGTHTAGAKVTINGPHRVEETGPEYHWLIYEYDDCAGISETIHLQSPSKGGLGGLAAKDDTIACLIDKKVGESIQVEMETRVHRISDHKTWRVSAIAGCPVHGVPVTMGIKGENRCPWM